MKGKFFCDVCDHWFNSDSDGEEAVCPGCNEDVLDADYDQPVNGFDRYRDEDATDYD